MSFAFSTFSSKITHKIFVSIAKNIVAAGFVILEIKFWSLEYRNKSSKFIDHFLTFTKLCFIIEVSVIYNSTKIIIISIGELCNNLVHFFSDIFISFE